MQKRTLLIVAIFLAVIIGGLIALEPWLSREAKTRLVKLLEERFESDLEIAELSVSLFPGVRASGKGLIFRHKGRKDVPPLIELRAFSAVTSLGALIFEPRRVSRVELEGLRLTVARGERKDEDKANRQAEGPKRESPVVVQEIIADGTMLRVLPRESWKEPLDFDIYKLTLKSVAADRPMRYVAQLRNAKPPGLIDAHGEFGPWYAGDPGLTPVNGQYKFENANLGAFRGLMGTLSSTGKFDGVLAKLEVEGQTDTPDFGLTAAGHKVHLKTQFKATVDGTDGDTILHPVVARFLNSEVIADGSVAGKKGQKGKTVSLDAVVQNARLEDLLKFGVKGTAPLKGDISFRTKIVIPPGDVDIADKLYLNGVFGIQGGQFTKFSMQQKVESLSDKASGDLDGDNETGDVFSNFRGSFQLADGAITFKKLIFAVPGATVDLTGSYALRQEALNFRGQARLEAKPSEMTTGVKSMLLKLIDPFVKKQGAGTVIPIKITGTRSAPSFGLALGK